MNIRVKLEDGNTYEVPFSLKIMLPAYCPSSGSLEILGFSEVEQLTYSIVDDPWGDGVNEAECLSGFYTGSTEEVLERYGSRELPK